MNITMLTKSIRAYCKWCCNGGTKEVEACNLSKCPLFPFRMGHAHKNKNALTYICKECLNCSGGYITEVRKCKHTKCNLYPYRLGIAFGKTTRIKRAKRKKGK